MKTKERLGVKDTLNVAGKLQEGCFLSSTFSLPPPPLTICRGRAGSKFSHLATHGHSHLLPAQPSWALLGAQETLLSPPHPQISVCNTQGPEQQPCPSHTHSPSVFSRPFLRTDTIVFFPQDKYLNHFGKFPPYTHNTLMFGLEIQSVNKFAEN